MTPNEFLLSLIGTSQSDCIIWPFKHGRDKRGAPHCGGTTAARFVCIAAHGPPKGKKDAAHSCGNGHLGCVNPNHVRWRTRRQNVREAMEHGVHVPPPRNDKLTPAKVKDIRRAQGKIHRDVLASRYGVSPRQINRIWARTKWPNV